MANRKFPERWAFTLKCCVVAVVSVVVFDVYKAVRPKHPDIDSPEALVEQSRQLIGTPLPWHFDMVEMPQEQWPPAIEALRPDHVNLGIRLSADKESVVDYVDIVISTGGIGGTYGYIVCFLRKGRADTFLVSGNSDLIFEDGDASIIRYIAD